MKKIAVITGASSGMGREFVYAIDKDSEQAVENKEPESKEPENKEMGNNK